jgi:hypothetical protein
LTTHTKKTAMSTMTITIERTPRTLQFAGQSLQVEELSIRLPFARKPADLGELGGRDQHKVYVTETKELRCRDTSRSSTPNLLLTLHGSTCRS